MDPTAGTVTHHVEGASFPNWMGGDQVRFYEFEDGKLVLSTPPFLYDGKSRRSVLIWERCR